VNREYDASLPLPTVRLNAKQAIIGEVSLNLAGHQAAAQYAGRDGEISG